MMIPYQKNDVGGLLTSTLHDRDFYDYDNFNCKSQLAISNLRRFYSLCDEKTSTRQANDKYSKFRGILPYGFQMPTAILSNYNLPKQITHT